MTTSPHIVVQSRSAGTTAAPDTLEILLDRVRGFAAAGRLTDAAQCWRDIIRLQPDLAAAHNNLGSTLAVLGDDTTAIDAYRAALRLQPDYPEAANNLGSMLCRLGQMGEGETLLRQAIAQRPDYARAHYNLGKALQEQGRIADAVHCFRSAITYAPNLAEAHVHMAYAMLADGIMPDGWAEFEWRHALPNVPRPLPLPLWRGEPLGSRVLLLEAEEGLGDTIQFCRYVPLLAPPKSPSESPAPAGTPIGSIVLQVQPSLARLLKDLAPVQIVSADDPLPPCDLRCGLMSLPHLLGTTLDTIPARSPYLRADPDYVAYWRHRLAGLTGVRVGLAWSGNPLYAADARRSIDANRLAVLAGVPGIAFVSLQVPPAAAAPPELEMFDPTPELGDLADTAALIEVLDLVISVDTAVLHLAGALGKPVWLLNRFDSDWRWLRARTDSPWYPTLRQFRQPAPGDWDAVLRDVRAALHGVPNRPGSEGVTVFEDGMRHLEAKRYPDAEKCFKETLRLWPDHYLSLHQLGLIALEYRQSETAIGLFSRVIQLHPGEATPLNNLGTALRGVGASAEAIICYREASRLRPDDPEILHNIGNTLTDLQEHAEAEVALRRAVALRPDLDNTHFALAWLLLVSGRLKEGWEEHRWRRKLGSYHVRPFPGEEWDGAPVGDRVLMLYSDEGYGDAIQCIRYLPMLGQCRIVLEVQDALVRLFKDLPNVTAVVATGKPLPPIDIHRPLLDLPGIFGTTVDTIPAEVPYLKTEPAIALRWQRRLAHLSGFRVGIVWAGNPGNVGDYVRSMKLTTLEPLLAAFPEVSFISLQKGPACSQIAELRGRAVLHDFTAELDDFADTAALIEALDLVIAVDTAVLHLAGALAVPVWLLNRFDTDWRWLLSRDDSPWYPTLRQFRQPELGDWDGVVEQVIAALRQHMADD